MKTVIVMEQRRPRHCCNKSLYAGLLASSSLSRYLIMTAPKLRLVHVRLDILHQQRA
jgi:hypothetical protein